MDYRNFGLTGLKVSALGLGTGQIGGNEISDKQAEHLLNYALDLGITLIDTARGYGLAEERIGKFLSKRKDEFVLSTKVGYGITGYNDWTYDIILAGIDEARKKLKTDVIDIVHLHSCPKNILESRQVVEALSFAKEKEMIKAAAYSGENEALHFAINDNSFQSIQTSINIFDQSDLNGPLQRAKEKGKGVIAKRPTANHPWKYSERPIGNYAEDYWLRMKKMNLDFGDDWNETALRFSAFTWGVDSVITGTSNIHHLKQNAASINKGKLPEDVYIKIRNAFLSAEDNWHGLV